MCKHRVRSTGQSASCGQQSKWKYLAANRRMQAAASRGFLFLIVICLLCSCASSSSNRENPQLSSTSRAVQHPTTAPITLVPLPTSTSPTSPTSVVPTGTSVVPTGAGHYEYVFPDGGIYVYDMDHGQVLVKHISLP